MRDYFIRRFLLIPPTLLGVTVIVFAITRLVPGGPLERAIMESQQFNNSGATSQIAGANMALSEAQLKKLQEYYGLARKSRSGRPGKFLPIQRASLGCDPG